jgi:oxygen-dependent protoporphyrinogen oxidase
MTGGSHDINLLNDSLEEIEEEILREFSRLTGIDQDPVYIKSVLWDKAIPQFHVGYDKIRHQLEDHEQQVPGFHFGGNYRWGVSVPDCIKGARELVKGIG